MYNISDKQFLFLKLVAFFAIDLRLFLFEGYELVGNPILKCTASGYETGWSHKMPFCKRK